jgi:hypothetical protein
MISATKDTEETKKKVVRKKIKKSKAQIILQDKLGNSWFCDTVKEEFKIFPDNRIIDVYDDTGDKKRFLKKFLKVESYLV